MTASENVAQENDDSRKKSDTFRKWRMEKVWELRATGCTVDEIVELLKQNKPDVKISHGTIYNDLKSKKKQIDEAFQQYIEDLPLQHQLSLTHLEMVKKQAWRIYYKSNDEKVQLQALNTAMSSEVEISKLQGDPDYISKAMKVTGKLKKQLEEQEAVTQE